VRVLRAALERAFVEQRTGHRSVRTITRANAGVDRSLDRRAAARVAMARLLGAPTPLIIVEERTRLAPERTAACVYLDVSGSMNGILPALHAALVQLRRLVAARIHVFSTEVHEATWREFESGRLPSTGGTDVTPVLQHVASLGARAPKRCLLITDGFFGDPPNALARSVRELGVAVHVAVADGGPLPRGEWVASAFNLPIMHTG
jgi:hypothetical protein